ncbi:hypothetical protein JKP88DRAFT_218338 [Tribonema minus]|uniref:Conidiation-specific protein 6 n=1 Tax=Tribonema minus TaxID=303371 RepID=A0A835Z7K8_9STRA|nr:hypothetical protein JKP88DRAFT_218338 [Tribonema minus]
MDGRNPGNVAGGIKAAINNPNVSDAKKDELKSRLDNEDFTPSVDKNPNNVQGGVKAAINNPNVSDEKKSELQSRLDG